MAPRDPDTNGNYKDNKLTEEPLDSEDFTPVILHKKHKVVKLMEAQLRKIRTEGLVCCEKGVRFEKIKTKPDEPVTVNISDYPEDSTTPEPPCILKMLLFIAKLIFLLLLIILVVWISAGPLSNKSPHTPISLWNSLITTDKSCTLEKKYLLRWSVSDYGE